MKGGEYQTNGLEHDEQGRPSSMYTMHETMNAKRWRKLDAIASKYELFTKFGPDNPDLGILCWGSSTGVVREAVDRLTAQGIRVARSQVRRILLADGARWRQVRSWAVSKDPQFVPKGQPSSTSTPARPRTRRSSASTNSAR